MGSNEISEDERRETLCIICDFIKEGCKADIALALVLGICLFVSLVNDGTAEAQRESK